MTLCNNHGLVLQYNYAFVFDIYIDRVEWNIERLMWIGFYKNEKNDACLLHKLPKDLITHIVKFFARIPPVSDDAPCIKL